VNTGSRKKSLWWGNGDASLKKLAVAGRGACYHGQKTARGFGITRSPGT
jgi:hypothetical protein